MIIRNARIFRKEGCFRDGEIRIGTQVFEEVKLSGPEETGHAPEAAGDSQETVIDAHGLYAIPGLVDIHFHGCMGHDLCEGSPEALNTLAEGELSRGVTAIVPATMTYDEETLSKVMEAVSGYRRLQEEDPASGRMGAYLYGVRTEGPFISPKKMGAQNPAYIRDPDIAMFRRLQEKAHGAILICDMAPEQPGGMEFIRELKDEVRISIAHTTADYETAKEAFETGASHVTHLFNAMPPLSHRAPGVIGAAADAEKAAVELICDGVHIHPSVIRAAFRIFGDDRICLISDSMMAAGLPDGEYSLGGQKVFVHGKNAVLEDGTLAGSVSFLSDCLKTAVCEMGIAPESAVKCASVNPARAAGIFDRCGSIDEGKSADLLLVDEKMTIQTVICRGRML